MCKLNYEIDISKMLPFFKDGKDCKIELYQDKQYEVFPLLAFGNEERIYTMYFTAYDYFKCGNYKKYVNFLIAMKNDRHLFSGFDIHIDYK